MNYSRYIPLISILGDFIILNIIFVFGFIYFEGSAISLSSKYIAFYTYLNLAWLLLVLVFNAHAIDRNIKKKAIIYVYINVIIIFFFLFLLYFQIVSFSYYPRHFIKILFPSFFFVLIVWKISLYYALYFYRKHGFNFRNVIILGNTEGTRKLEKYFTSNNWHGYRFLGFFDDEQDQVHNQIGALDDLKPFIENNHVDEIFLAWNGIPAEKMQDITALISDYPFKVHIVPNFGDFAYKSAELINYGALPVIQINPGPLSYLYNRLVKRFVDILISLLVILGVLPWLTAILYFISMLGPRQGVFYKQQRTRVDGKVFSIIKYKSMRDCPNPTYRNPTEFGQDVTLVGKFLRKFSIDELPQFINVLLGDMSVVGPRPHMVEHTEQYRKQIKRFMLRHTIKPGITGLAQVSGFRGEIRSIEDIKHRVELDVNYIENWSLSLDFKIMVYTFGVVYKGL
ncbi:MAG: exopolysaccharide biosynthesis polyprenyl glycosylphosphotransferase [Bacteroidales bacterium]